MKYDFTTVLDRCGHQLIATDKIPFEGLEPDEGFDAIPMWIADMSFPTAPPVLDEIRRRMDFPNFGYFAPGEEYYSAIIDWQRRHNGVEGLEKQHIGYENGVLGGVSSAIQAFTALARRFCCTLPPMWASPIPLPTPAAPPYTAR